MDNKQTALAFIDAINRQDIAAIIGLMTDDHFFIDTYGDPQDKETMKTGWPGYFEWFPDYKIEIVDLMIEGDVVAVFGFAGGSYYLREDRAWRLPACWRATIKDGKVQVWQVFCDSKLPYETMEE